MLLFHSSISTVENWSRRVGGLRFPRTCAVSCVQWLALGCPVNISREGTRRQWQYTLKVLLEVQCSNPNSLRLHHIFRDTHHMVLFLSEEVLPQLPDKGRKPLHLGIVLLLLHVYSWSFFCRRRCYRSYPVKDRSISNWLCPPVAAYILSRRRYTDPVRRQREVCVVVCVSGVDGILLGTTLPETLGAFLILLEVTSLPLAQSRGWFLPAAKLHNIPSEL